MKKRGELVETLWADALHHWVNTGMRLERTFESHQFVQHKFSLHNSAREQVTFIHDFGVEAFENMTRTSSFPQALQVVAVSPTKSFNEIQKGMDMHVHFSSFLSVERQ